LVGALLFWIFHTIHNLGFVTVLQSVAAGYNGEGAESQAAEAVARALLGFANSAFGFGTGVGGLFLVGYLACFGMATVKTGGLPRWTGFVAFASAALALLAYLQVVSPLLGPVLGVPSWILHIVWVIGVTVALLRGSSTVESRSVRYA